MEQWDRGGKFSSEMVVKCFGSFLISSEWILAGLCVAGKSIKF